MIWIVIVLLCALLALFVYQAARTAFALQHARTDVTQLSSQLAAGDLGQARDTAGDLAAQGRVAHSHSRNLLWRGASAIPFVGDDVGAVRVVARVLDEMSSAYPDALTAYSTVSDRQLRSADGRIDVRRVSALAPTLEPLARSLTRADDDLAEVVPGDLVPPLRRAMTKVQDQVGQASSLARGGATASRLIEPMLGADGPRTYLLVVQNNAEIRATGGLPGAFSLLTAQDGKVRLGAQKSQPDFPTLRKPVLPLTAGEQALYGDNLGTDLRDTNATPDFPRTAELLSAMLAQRFGKRFDGVVSVDPVTLKALLVATGPIRVGSQTFTEDNVLEKLLNDVYVSYPEAEQDAYFATAARGIFDTLLTGELDQKAALGVLSEAAGQRRLLVWSRRAEEQQRLDGTSAGGALPRDTGTTPHVGLYLNDSRKSKMEYYLDYTGSFAAASCTDDGTQTLQAGLVLKSSMPSDPSSLPDYITGLDDYAPKGWMRLNLRIYAPTGGKVVSITANERGVPVTGALHDGHRVAVVQLMIKPQEQVRIKATLRTRAGQRGDPELQWTPGMRWQQNGLTVPSACD